jgi:hypothetical protein
LKERIREELEPDFLLIDARTGITEIGGVATTLLADKVVCLLLNNRENLDGARAVLRSFRRAPRPPHLARVETIPVLSRIPTYKNQQEEQKLVSDIQDFLNEEAEMVADTLNVTDLFVLHAEPQLEVSERILVGGEGEREDSVLLRDYLKLFSHLVSPEQIRPHIGPLIDRARSVVMDDPEGAQRELENLAYSLNQPDAFRELLKLYRVRRSPAPVVMEAAQRYWELSANRDGALVWEVVRERLAGWLDGPDTVRRRALLHEDFV